MSDNLLLTKLFVPPLRSNLVPRPHLIKRLNRSLNLGHKLSLISAPAGFGKTTVVSEWLDNLRSAAGSSPQISTAWYSLDESDNDPGRFFSYFIAALNQTGAFESAIGQKSLGLLQSPQQPPIEELLIALINRITALPQRVILVLDDYHLIDTPALDDALIFLIEHLPPQMHLVVITREDPNLPLARFRVRGQLTELRAADLRFTASEAAQFLNQVMGLNLSAEDISAMDIRTEGWIAGLRLAAISMQGHKDSSHLVKSFTGSHRFVLDYLIEEVLEQQPQNIQNFLLQTAVLNRLTGPLCDALTGQDDGQETLEALDRANLFIFPLDDERQWYRYHHLFAELLRRRLVQTHQQEIPTLRHRASAWHEQNGFAAEAIEHALRAEEYERTAELIKEHIDDLWGRGEHRKLSRWLDGLPEELLSNRPYISLYQARYQCSSGQLDKAEQTLRAVETVLERGTISPSTALGQIQPALTTAYRRRLRGRAASTRALICSYQGDVPGIIEHGGMALEFLPREDLSWRSVTALTLGNAHGFKGDMGAAYAARLEALHNCEAVGDAYFVLVANLQVAITLREQGRLRQTIEICRQQMECANEIGLAESKTVGWLLAVWGETLAELNDLNGALDRAKKSFALTMSGEDLQMLGWSFMCLIRVLFTSGDLDQAEETIRMMENFARDSYIPPWVANQMAAWKARLWLAADKLDAASQWVEDRGLDPGEDPLPPQKIDFFSLFDYTVLARILLAQERLEEAGRLLRQLLKAAKAGNRTSKVIEIKILQSLTHQAGGEIDRAMITLQQALTLAQPEGFIRLFVEEGPPMGRLLTTALSREITPDYVRRLLAAFPTAEPSQAVLLESSAIDHELLEPLSEREIEVLQLIAEGLTNQEVATRLYLSLFTVKVHARNIFSKLNVHNRMQAVAKARALNILPAV